MRSRKSLSVVTGALSLLMMASHHVLAAPSAEDIQKVTAALPEKAQVAPAQPRKLLVFTHTNGFVHSSIGLGARALELMGQKTGAYTATISDDLAMLEPDSLKQFDAVCMVSTTGNIFIKPNTPDAQQNADKLEKSVADFVSSGHGWIGIHAASDVEPSGKPYGELVGGVFNGHPWNEKVGVSIQDKTSPLTRDLVAAFPTGEFDIADEMYQFKSPPYNRANQRILLALDLSKTAHKDGMNRKQDNDYAVSWIKSYGQGRVFYCSLGHREEIYWNPNILKYYLNGIQFALGDLQADTTSLPQPPQTDAAGATVTGAALNPTGGATAQVVQLGGAAGAPGVSQPPADPVDNFMGEYAGTFTPDGGAATPLMADVVGQGNGSYQVVLFMPTATGGKTKRMEITGKQQDNAVPFTSNAGGLDWTGSLGGGNLTLSGKGTGGGAIALHKVIRHSPTEGLRPPANAIVLLPYVPSHAPALTEWTNKDWPTYGDGSVSSAGNNSTTVREFGDLQLHCEFRLPYEPTERGQGRANSGIGFTNRYEIQILDSFGLVPGAGDVGSIYNIVPPSVNPEFPPLQWQTYDIVFHAAQMGPDGKLEKLPRVTVYLNGVKVQDNNEIPRPTGIGPGENAARGPLQFQFHHHPVRFRNAWVVDLTGMAGQNAEQNLAKAIQGATLLNSLVKNRGLGAEF